MKVSIIIPVYNVSAYIERCIESVMNQTYKDIECIIVDDASPDDSIEKCEKMIAEYDGPIRFTILHHNQNRGISAARNTGTKASLGEYLLYLDSDDEIKPNCIETLIKPMTEDCTIDLVQGNHVDERNGQEICNHKRESSIYISMNDDVYKEYYIYHHFISTAWNKLIKRSYIEKYKLYFKEGLLHEDFLWFYYVMKHLERAYICKNITYIYRIRTNSIMTSGYNIAKGNSYLFIFNAIFNNLSPQREKTELRGNLKLFYRVYSHYSHDIPAFNNLHSLYLKKAWRYGCWKEFFILSIIGIVCRSHCLLTIARNTYCYIAK